MPAWTQWDLVQHPVTCLKIHLSFASYTWRLNCKNSASGQHGCGGGGSGGGGGVVVRYCASHCIQLLTNCCFFSWKKNNKEHSQMEKMQDCCAACWSTTSIFLFLHCLSLFCANLRLFIATAILYSMCRHYLNSLNKTKHHKTVTVHSHKGQTSVTSARYT